MRVYEWGNEAGRKIMMVHGDATCAPLWKTVAEELVGRGCRVIVFGEHPYPPSSEKKERKKERLS
jgi:hypothetical protein